MAWDKMSQGVGQMLCVEGAKVPVPVAPTDISLSKRFLWENYLYVISFLAKFCILIGKICHVTTVELYVSTPSKMPIVYHFIWNRP